ncbi:uncharacterized protein LOC111188826 [Astyanax mexicanus]|uniref:uncharacterized protein LOC111188826 n=1 Tax=Astyanax mexicanus TaxID=7994 RepID=UPI0020CB1F55|nr:uncharacterized protein LOC111188826 [Astyanax mexicanus]
MGQICCSGENSKKTSNKKVVNSLKDGLSSINRVYEALIDGDVDPLNYECTREQIVRAEQSLDQSEKAASKGLKGLDKDIETLTLDEGRLEQMLKETKDTLENLRTKQESNEALLRQSEESLEEVTRHLNSAKDKVQALEERKRNAEIVWGVGAGLLAIPVVGWIAGPIMMVHGAAEHNQALEALKVAEEEMSNCADQVEKYRSKVSKYNSKISQTEREIKKKHDKIKQIHKKIPELKRERAVVAELQSNLRKAVHILSTLSGKANVVECQTRSFVLLEPVMKVMEDVIKSAGDIAESQFLSDKGILRLLDTMREKHNVAVRMIREKQSLEASSDACEMYT